MSTAQLAPSARAPRTLENVSRYRHPVAFFLWATATSWVLWFAAAWLSRQDGTSYSAAIAGLSMAGLVAPVVVAIWFIRRNGLGRDVLARLVAPRGTRAWVWLTAIFVLPAALLAATAISVAFGYDVSQFQFRNGFSFATGLIPAWVTLAAAAVLEELAWHTYGTDAIASRMRILWTSLLFGAVWVLWHVPLGFIEGYYQAEVVEEGLIHTLNFALSVVPFVILMNWLYYRGGRSVLIAIIFHLSANFGNELFLTHPDTKVIQTGLLLVLSVGVLWYDRHLFFARPGKWTDPAMLAR